MRGRPQLAEEPFAGHLEDVEVRHAGRRFEKEARPAAELHDLSGIIDQNTRGRVSRQSNAIGLAEHIPCRRRLDRFPQRERHLAGRATASNSTGRCAAVAFFL